MFIFPKEILVISVPEHNKSTISINNLREREAAILKQSTWLINIHEHFPNMVDIHPR